MERGAAGEDAFMLAAMHEKCDNIRAWLQYFDGGLAFVERTDVNLQVIPCTKKLRWLVLFARWAVEHDVKGALLQELAAMGGVTPLMNAARRGKVAEVRALLNMKADPTLRNDQGLTALEMARIK